jgi:hypothetical protein
MLTFKTIRATKKNIQHRLVFFKNVEIGELVRSSYTKKYHFKLTDHKIKFKEMFLESFSNKEIKKLIFNNLNQQ